MNGVHLEKEKDALEVTRFVSFLDGGGTPFLINVEVLIGFSSFVRDMIPAPESTL